MPDRKAFEEMAWVPRIGAIIDIGRRLATFTNASKTSDRILADGAAAKNGIVSQSGWIEKGEGRGDVGVKSIGKRLHIE